MKIQVDDGVFDLQPGQLLKLTGASGAKIHCVAGTLWITQEGRYRDDFACAGQSVDIAATGLTVIEATGEVAARIRLHAPAEHPATRMEVRERAPA